MLNINISNISKKIEAQFSKKFEIFWTLFSIKDDLSKLWLLRMRATEHCIKSE